MPSLWDLALGIVFSLPFYTLFKLCTSKQRRLRHFKLFFFSLGGFICIYVGNLYTNEEANKQGQDFGDEYFAELDLIEVVEGRKEGNFSISKKKEFLYDSIHAIAIEIFLYLFITWWTLTGMGRGFQVWKFHLKISPWEEKPCLPRSYGSWEANFSFPANFWRWRNFHTWNSAHSEILYSCMSYY